MGLNAALQGFVQEGGVVAFGVHGLGADQPFVAGIEKKEVCGVAGLEVVDGQFEDFCGLEAPQIEQLLLSQDAFGDQMLSESEGCVQTRDTVRSFV